MLVFPLSVFFFLKSKYKVNAIIGIAILFVLSFVLITKVPYFYNVLGVRVFDMFEIIKQGQDFSGGADNSRFLLFIYGFEWFQESPAIGSGINNYRVLSNITPPFVGRNFYAHSNIIEMLVGVGIVGTIIYYSIIYFLIRRAKSINSAYYKVVITIGLTFLFHDIFSMSYYEYEMQLLLCTSYILIGLKKENNK
jgi:O-antigen ligase